MLWKLCDFWYSKEQRVHCITTHSSFTSPGCMHKEREYICEKIGSSIYSTVQNFQNASINIIPYNICKVKIKIKISI